MASNAQEHPISLRKQYRLQLFPLEAIKRSLAQVMGELQLVELFEEGQRRIKRDIVFAASLYL